MNHPADTYSLERCRSLLGQLNAYLDGELPADLCTALETHLAACPDCRVVVDTLSQTIHILQQMDSLAPALPAQIEARLLERLALPLTQDRPSSTQEAL